MTLNLENLKQKYKVFFQNEERLELIINEVIFGYAEIKEFIEKKNIKSILEVGCGTGILLCELKNRGHFNLSEIYVSKLFSKYFPKEFTLRSIQK